MAVKNFRINKLNNYFIYIILSILSVTMPMVTKYFYDEVDYNLKRLDKLEIEVAKINSQLIDSKTLIKLMNDVAVLKSKQLCKWSKNINERRDDE